VKRTKALRLVLLGGGVATMLAACGDDQARALACQQAKEQLRADADEICRRSASSSRSSSSGWSSWSSGRSGSSYTRSSSSSSSRSGFGSSSSSSGS
jgi:hypothetical protein